MLQLRMLLGLALAFLVFVVHPTIGGICNDGLCRCRGKDLQTPTRVACACYDQIQELDITSAMMNSISQAQQFTVSDCKVLHFKRNSFAALHNLTKVSVKRVELVTFTPGVFSNLEALALEGVEKLQLEPRAFMGIRDVFHIDIRDTTISELPKQVMYDAMGLRSMRFTNVTIGTIRTEAISVQLEGQDSRFVMDNCTVMDIENNGVRVLARDVNIKDTLFGAVADNGIHLMASGEVVVSGCDLRSGLKNSTIEVTAPHINVTGNTVNYLEIGALRNIHVTSGRNMEGHCWFTNNTIHQLNVKKQTPNIDIRLFTVEGNALQCDCDISDAIVFVQMISDHPVFQNNFCIASCNVTLKEFSHRMSADDVCEQQTPGNNIDGIVLCDLPETTTSVDALHPTRQGKAWQLSTEPPRHGAHQGHVTTAAPHSSVAHILCDVQLIVTTVLLLLLNKKLSQSLL